MTEDILKIFLQETIVPLYEHVGVGGLCLHVGVHPGGGQGLAGRVHHHPDQLHPHGVRHSGLCWLRAGLRCHSLPHSRGDDACRRAVHCCGTLYGGGDVVHLPAVKTKTNTDGQSPDSRTVRHVFL